MGNIASIDNNRVAIEITAVSKIYKFYSNLLFQAIDVLGFSNLFRIGKKSETTAFKALDNVSLKINAGERIGIIGRNGAGKTTLLKLITGNFLPTQGTVLVNGKIQALMQVGLGFHPEFSGHENIKSSLHYNGLSGDDFAKALQEIIDFVELEEFLYQPIKTYSLGMLSRLQFATATAINPDILIVDEILGAGDAYFSGKSSARMEKLAYSGCTLLLVSHAIPQILQFCERGIWIENGKIVMDSDVLSVVKKYEEFIRHLSLESEKNKQVFDLESYQSTLPKWMRERILEKMFLRNSPRSGIALDDNISRWPTEGGLRIIKVEVIDHFGVPSKIVYTHNPLEINIEFLAEEKGEYDYVAVIVLFTKDGRYLCRHCSHPLKIELKKGQKSVVKLKYPENRLGNGDYVFSAALYKELDLNNLNMAKAYDLLSRSFEIKIQDKHIDDATLFHHPAIWISEERTC